MVGVCRDESNCAVPSQPGGVAVYEDESRPEREESAASGEQSVYHPCFLVPHVAVGSESGGVCVDEGGAAGLDA